MVSSIRLMSYMDRPGLVVGATQYNFSGGIFRRCGKDEDVSFWAGSYCLVNKQVDCNAKR